MTRASITIAEMRKAIASTQGHDRTRFQLGNILTPFVMLLWIASWNHWEHALGALGVYVSVWGLNLLGEYVILPWYLRRQMAKFSPEALEMLGLGK